MTAAPCLCPHCGHDLQREEPLERDGFRYVPGRRVEYDGRSVRLNQTLLAVFGTIMRTTGCVTMAALYERLGSEAEDPSNLMAVYLCRIRSALRAVRAPDPFERVYRQGVRWGLGGQC